MREAASAKRQVPSEICRGIGGEEGKMGEVGSKGLNCLERRRDDVPRNMCICLSSHLHTKIQVGHLTPQRGAHHFTKLGGGKRVAEGVWGKVRAHHRCPSFSSPGRFLPPPCPSSRSRLRRISRRAGPALPQSWWRGLREGSW